MGVRHLTLTMENALQWEGWKTSARMRELKEKEDSMMHRRSRKEMKRDSEAHYHSMEDHAPDPRAAERFRRKPYTGAKVLIRRQIGDAAEKYNIRGDADGQEDS